MTTTARCAALVAALLGFSCSSESPADPGNDSSDDCENRADTFFAGVAKSTDDGTIRVEIASADPAPPTIAGKNLWRLELTKDGAPLPGATIAGSTFMRDHGHPGNSALSTDLGSGTYELGPFQLRMPGLWEITLEVRPMGGPTKTVIFNFCLPKS